MTINPYTGKLAEPAKRVNAPKLVCVNYTETPDPLAPDVTDITDWI